MAVLEKGIDGRYKVSAYIEYEIKGTGNLQYAVSLSPREIKRRAKDIKKLAKVLCRMKKRGFDIELIEAGVEE